MREVSPERAKKIRDWWNNKRPDHNWAWFLGLRCNTDDEYRGLYPTKEIALEHQPVRGRLHRLHPVREWIRWPEDPAAQGVLENEISAWEN